MHDSEKTASRRQMAKNGLQECAKNGFESFKVVGNPHFEGIPKFPPKNSNPNQLAMAWKNFGFQEQSNKFYKMFIFLPLRQISGFRKEITSKITCNREIEFPLQVISLKTCKRGLKSHLQVLF